jgi:hypothetical protein
MFHTRLVYEGDRCNEFKVLRVLIGDDDDDDDDDEYKPIWPSGLWATCQGGKIGMYPHQSHRVQVGSHFV